MINKITKNFLFILIFFLFFSTFALSSTKIEILYKINDQIVTSKDLENEKKFLLFLNSKLKKLSDEKIEKISEDSLLNRKIKEIELNKYFNLSNNSKGKDAVDNFILNANISRDILIKQLKSINLEYDYLENNFLIDNLWREYIFNRFKAQVKINFDDLRKKIQNQSKEIVELNLSEILFEVKSNLNLEELTNQIYAEIDKYGFEAAASIYSRSDSKNFGGNLGWVKSNQISKLVYSEIKKADKITRPIKTKNGYLIIKINEKRKITEKINEDEELKKLVNAETNKELNKFGYIYFNKIKKRVFISEN